MTMQKCTALCRKGSWPISLVLSFFSVAGLLYYGFRLRDSLLSVTNSILAVLLFAFCAMVFHRAILVVNRRLLAVALCGGMLFSGMLVLGAEIFTVDSVNLLKWEKWVGVLLVGLFFAALLICLLESVPQLNAKLECWNSPRIRDRFFNGGWRYFLVVWAIIFICWLPALLASYPGIFAYDSVYQMRYMLTDHQLNAHHPILHTLYLYGSLLLGEKLFGSMSHGMLLYSVSQMLMLSAAFAYACRFLAKRRVGVLWQAAAIAYFALWPIHAMFSVSATKDVLFAALMLLLVLFTLEMVQHSEAFFHSRFQMIRYVVTVFLMFAMRNNGIYVFLVMIPFLIILLRRYWKRLACICAVCVALYATYTGPVYKLLNVEPGGIQEILSVPLQQMARVANVQRDEMTDEEYSQLCEIIPPEIIPNYISRTADPIKNYLNKDQLKEDPGKYVKLWLSMGLKHPGTYISSFLCNNFGYWYPDMVYRDPAAWHPYIEFQNTPEMPGYVTIKTESKAPGLQKIYQDIAYGTVHQKIPVVSMLFSPGFSFWLLLLYMMALIYYKKYKGLLPPLYLFLLWGTLLLGPVVLLRYAYPIMVTMPVLLVLFVHETDWNLPPGRKKRKRRRARRKETPPPKETLMESGD